MEHIYDDECIFCKIIKGEIKSDIIKENEYCIAFNDVSPKAKTHILIVPKTHVKDIMYLDDFFMSKVLETIKLLASELNLDEKGFRVINNCGKEAGQTVFHVHFHLLSGNIKF